MRSRVYGYHEIRGEVRIIEENTNFYLINYDQRSQIPADGSFELISSSYVYLTIEADNTPSIKSYKWREHCQLVAIYLNVP